MNSLQISYLHSLEELTELQRELNLWESIALPERESQILSDSLLSINFAQVFIRNKIDSPRAWENYRVLLCRDTSSKLQGVAVISEMISLHILVSNPGRLIERGKNGCAEPKDVGTSLLLAVIKEALVKNCPLVFLIKSSSLPFYKKIFGSPILETDYNRISLIRIWIAYAALKTKPDNPKN